MVYSTSLKTIISRTLAVGAVLLGCSLFKVACGQSWVDTESDGVQVDGPVIGRQKYSFTIRTLAENHDIAIPNGTPIAMRLIRPHLDFESERISMMLPISARDGDAANNITVSRQLPVPLYIRVQFASEDQRAAIVGQEILPLTFYSLAARPFDGSLAPELSLNGQLIAGGKPGIYRLVTESKSYQVRLIGRRGLLTGFSILDLEPHQCIAFVIGKSSEEEFIATAIEFAPISDSIENEDPNLPRCLFLGDSVSFNYQRALRESLAGKINLHHPPESCRGSESASILHHWLGDYTQPKRGWDVITFNFGLHDVETSREAYQENLRQAVNHLTKTGARLIWITSTPVDYGFNGNGKAGVAASKEERPALKYVADSPAGMVPGRMGEQNRWAAEVLAEFPEVEICDFWQLVKDGEDGFYQDWWYNKNANFNYPESIPLARHLARYILRASGSAGEINPASHHLVEIPENYH